ncbi:MAG: type 1 glutamine amidotransferase [Anaerolineae bacterium]|nr:type 1 glutamine amidotransferase [Anaerolineae bacterium]
MKPLEGKRIVVLAEDLFEDLELWYPLIRMKEAGAEVTVAGTTAGVNYHGKQGLTVQSDTATNGLEAADFDAVIIPGGYAPDKMRRHEATLKLVRDIFNQGGVVAMICHAGWVPISAGIVSGKNVTSTSAIKDDLINAGAQWSDQAVVIDGNLISSRSPQDLPVFCEAIIQIMNGDGAQNLS